MRTATYTAPRPLLPVTRLRRWPFLLLALLVVAGLGGVAWLLHSKGSINRDTVASTMDTGSWAPWLKQPITYPAAPEPPATPPPPSRDSEDLQRVLAEMGRLNAKVTQQQQMLEELAQRPVAEVPEAVSVAHEPNPVKKRKAQGMLFVEHKGKEEKISGEPRYVLAPGTTKIPCIIETEMQSEIPGVFTAKVTTGVYDTATGKHLLIPQGSTILGKYNSSQLLFGNTRIPTISMLVSLPNASTVDLGQSPITDNLGVQGLTGDVDQRYWELFRAIFIGGVLKGGVQVAQMGAAEIGPAGTIGSGVVSEGSQQGQGRLRSLDTRPRITVHAGQLCTVILTQAIKLPGFYE